MDVENGDIRVFASRQAGEREYQREKRSHCALTERYIEEDLHKNFLPLVLSLVLALSLHVRKAFSSGGKRCSAVAASRLVPPPLPSFCLPVSRSFLTNDIPFLPFSTCGRTQIRNNPVHRVLEIRFLVYVTRRQLHEETTYEIGIPKEIESANIYRVARVKFSFQNPDSPANFVTSPTLQ